MKALRWFFKWGLISLLSLITLIFVLISGGANPIINSQLARLERVISQEAQRPVTLSKVDLRAFPNLVLELDTLSLGEREGSGWSARREPLKEPTSFVELKQVAFRFKLWRAIVSLGQDLELEAMNIEGLHITLHRDREGRWNFEEGADEGPATLAVAEPVVEPTSPGALQSTAEAPRAPRRALSPEERQRQRAELRRLLSSLKLSGVGVRDLKVRLIDEWGLEEGAPPRTLTLAKVDLSFPRLELMDIIEGSLSASLFEERENLTMSFRLGPMSALFDEGADKRADEGAELDFVPFPIEFSFKANALSFEALSPYVPAEALARVETMKLNGGFELQLDPKGEVRSSGELSLKGLQLKERPEGDWGPEIELTLHPQLLVSLPEDLVDLNGLSVQLNEMALKMSGQVTELSSEVPQIKGLELKTEAVRFERLMSLIPSMSAQLPPGASLSGPLTLMVKTSGDQEAQQVAVLIDLTSASLQLPEQLAKPAGVPVRLSLEAGISPSRVQLSSLEAQLSDLVLKLNGVILPKQGSVTLKGGVSPFSINNIVRLIPSVQAAIPPELTVAGLASLDLDLQQSGDKLTLDLKTGLERCQLDTPAVKLIGSGRAEVSMQGDPAKQLNISVLSDLKGLAIKAGEAFDKPTGVPLDLQLQLEQSPAGVKIPKLEAHVASLDLVGVGRQSAAGFELDATLKPSPLGPLFALAPSAEAGLSPGLKQGRLGFKLKLSAPQGSDELSVALSSLSLVTPKSEVRGQLSLKRPSQPVIDFAFNIPRLDLDELSPPSTGGEEVAEAPASETSEEGGEAPSLTLNGSLDIKKGSARGVTFKDLKARVAMSGPKVTVSALQVKVFKGLVKAAPLKVSLPGEDRGHFQGDFTLDKVDLDQAFKVLSPEAKRSVGGRLSAGLNLEGEGSSWEELSPTLHGQGSILLNQGVLYGLDPEAAIFNALSEKVPGVKTKRPRPLKLKKLSGKVEVKGGAVHMQEPIDVETSEGPLSLEGSLGLNLNADLSATLSLDPKRVSKQLGRPVPQKGPIKVPFKVSGPLSDPKVSGVGLATLIGVAAVALGGGEALKAAKQLKERGAEALKQGKGKAKRALKRAQGKAQQKLKREQARAQARAEEAKRAAEAKAKREAEEAKRRAQKAADEAKKKADKAKKKAEKAKKKAQESTKGAAKKLKGLF